MYARRRHVRLIPWTLHSGSEQLLWDRFFSIHPIPVHICKCLANNQEPGILKYGAVDRYILNMCFDVSYTASCIVFLQCILVLEM
jgi:hypothetical protein